MAVTIVCLKLSPCKNEGGCVFLFLGYHRLIHGLTLMFARDDPAHIQEGFPRLLLCEFGLFPLGSKGVEGAQYDASKCKVKY